MKGEVVGLYLFDVGGTFDMAGLRRSLAAHSPARPPVPGKGTPSYVEFPKPLVVASEPVPLTGPPGVVRATASLAFFPLGVVSVRLRVPVQAGSPEALTAWSRSTVAPGGGLPLEAAARQILERERPAWEPHVRERYASKVLSEAYTVFALTDVGEPATDFLESRGPQIAGILKGEDPARLHEKEVKESLKRWFSYYADDLVVIDWDAALIVDPDGDYEDLLFVLEIANLQLLEFRAFDDHLDRVTARAYDELEALFRRAGLFRNVRRTVHELSLLRIEVAQLADEADNITKFLGDWFLARVYQAAQEKIHLQDWRATVDEKLLTINKLYQLASEESDSNRMIVLELLIVLLFVADLAMLVLLRL